ncbi:IclR family transcriptional regulator [Labrenzia sp. 011]|uniref:IclR family transcriptional regulator n=1 Tax=Labrenzia sp. 011 TaxID=2171494 RepID=UPI000D5187C0|nr:IclR family transcriptional regulator [Labrenzia sp. 011]PVB60574.1 IclR family transcriptional regulator [Labrenzia sp. 011]
MVAQINGSVVKAFEILKLFSAGRTIISAADVMAELGVNAVTAHRFLKTLEHVGALVAVDRGRYRLGFLFADLAERLLDGGSLAGILQPVLNALTGRLGEASMATLFRADKVVCIARAVPDRPVLVDIRVGSELEAWCTAHGKLWLAHLPEKELDAYFSRVDPRAFTGATITGEAALRAELERVRREGFAENRGEREDTLHAIAVPLFSGSGRMITGLSVFGPVARLSGEAAATALAHLKHAAEDLHRSLDAPR